jgi:hypothetical protein
MNSGLGWSRMCLGGRVEPFSFTRLILLCVTNQPSFEVEVDIIALLNVARLLNNMSRQLVYRLECVNELRRDSASVVATRCSAPDPRTPGLRHFDAPADAL